MNLGVTEEEREFLLELLEEKQKGLIHEINHTDTNDFEELLRKKLRLLEDLKRKTEGLVVARPSLT